MSGGLGRASGETAFEMDNDQSEQFVLLFTEHEIDVRSFVTTLLFDWDGTREVMQQVSLQLWRKFSEFQPGADLHRSFVAWALQIASYEVFNYRRKRQRDRLVFSDELLEQLAETRLEAQDLLESRRRALAKCLGRLREADRELIGRRYFDGVNGIDLAKERQQPADSIYKALRRIRHQLFECINRTLRAAEAP